MTYKDHPLYLYTLDHGAGQISGQGQNFFGGKWFVALGGRQGDQEGAAGRRDDDVDHHHRHDLRHLRLPLEGGRS